MTDHDPSKAENPHERSVQADDWRTARERQYRNRPDIRQLTAQIRAGAQRQLDADDSAQEHGHDT